MELNDFNCGLKAYKNEVVKNIEVSGEMHRYIPVLAKRRLRKNWRESRHPSSQKIRFNQIWNGAFYQWLFRLDYDLVSLKIRKKANASFGALGVFMFLIGFTSAGYIGFMKLYRLYDKQPTILITDNPWFYIALATMVIGTQLFLAGFLGEIILRTKITKNDIRFPKK